MRQSTADIEDASAKQLNFAVRIYANRPGTDTIGKTGPSMKAQGPSRYGYSYRKLPRLHEQQSDKHDDSAMAAQRRFRMFGLEWRLQPLYEQAGCPFGEHDAGMLLWIDFGRRSHSN